MSLHLFPASQLVVAGGVLYAPHEVHQPGERRARVRVKQAWREQYVPTTSSRVFTYLFSGINVCDFF